MQNKVNQIKKLPCVQAEILNLWKILTNKTWNHHHQSKPQPSTPFLFEKGTDFSINKKMDDEIK